MTGDLSATPEFRLADLVAIHARERHALELPDALGDGALLSRVPVLANARRTLMELGYRFAPGSEIAGAHAMFPILELTGILRTKTIPYQRTALAAEQVLASCPDLALTDQMFREICVASYTFHEGAHAIFYESACTLEGVPQGRRFVEVVLASEAFAMAFEQLVSLLVLADDRRSTALFLAVSAYAHPLDHERFARDDAGALVRLGQLASEAPAQVLSLLVAAHLVALLRPTAVAGAGLAERLAAAAGLQDAMPADKERLTAIGFHVAPEFRDRTQRNFYGYLHLGHELDAVRARPLDEALSGDSAVTCFLPRATASVLGAAP